MKNPMAEVYDESHAQKDKKNGLYFFFSDAFGSRRVPRHSGNISDETCYYTSIVARVMSYPKLDGALTA